jgi:hypothetical protein
MVVISFFSSYFSVSFTGVVKRLQVSSSYHFCQDTFEVRDFSAQFCICHLTLNGI